VKSSVFKEVSKSLRLYEGSMKALLRLYEGSIKALLCRVSSRRSLSSLGSLSGALIEP
jgi:hypothetical protein